MLSFFHYLSHAKCIFLTKGHCCIIIRHSFIKGKKLVVNNGSNSTSDIIVYFEVREQLEINQSRQSLLRYFKKAELGQKMLASLEINVFMLKK